MEKIGWSEKEWNKKIAEEGCEEFERKLMDIQEQEWKKKLEKSKFADKLNPIIGKERGVYNKEWVKRKKEVYKLLRDSEWEVKQKIQNIEKRKRKGFVEYVERRWKILSIC